jgi:hypothetical protein
MIAAALPCARASPCAGSPNAPSTLRQIGGCGRLHSIRCANRMGDHRKIAVLLPRGVLGNERVLRSLFERHRIERVKLDESTHGLGGQQCEHRRRNRRVARA